MSDREGKRTIHHGDGIEWLRNSALGSDAAIVTSLPDTSELPELGFDDWQQWFVDTSELICRSAADSAMAIFYQTDIQHEGRWVDKSALVTRGANRAESHLIWRKVVCRVPPGTTTFGRPAYAHLLCFSRTGRIHPKQSTPDVLPQTGEMRWSRAMGSDACASVIDFLAKHTSCKTVVDPFCGQGSILSAANAAGLDAIGVETSRRRAAKARKG